MIKRLLVYFFVALCSNIWASESLSASVQSGNGSNFEAVQEEIDKAFAIKAMESVATKEELGAFEKIALQDPKRALELSMYYQGWGKDECFYVFDDDGNFRKNVDS
ncbi:MAG: hypothetical protein R3Y46_05360 [Opitutales bacterium]